MSRCVATLCTGGRLLPLLLGFFPRQKSGSALNKRVPGSLLALLVIVSACTELRSPNCPTQVEPRARRIRARALVFIREGSVNWVRLQTPRLHRRLVPCVPRALERLLLLPLSARSPCSSSLLLPRWEARKLPKPRQPGPLIKRTPTLLFPGCSLRPRRAVVSSDGSALECQQGKSALGLLSDAGVHMLSSWRCGDLGRMLPSNTLDLPALGFAYKAEEDGAACCVQVNGTRSARDGAVIRVKELNGVTVQFGTCVVLSAPRANTADAALSLQARGTLIHDPRTRAAAAAAPGPGWQPAAPSPPAPPTLQHHAPKPAAACRGSAMSTLQRAAGFLSSRSSQRSSGPSPGSGRPSFGPQP